MHTGHRRSRNKLRLHSMRPDDAATAGGSALQELPSEMHGHQALNDVLQLAHSCRDTISVLADKLC